MAVVLDDYVRKTSWMDDPRVKCRGTSPALFYPNQPSSEVARAKAVCNGEDGSPPCPMKSVCIRHAIDENEMYGVWGGTSERDRRKIQRARRRTKNLNIYSLEDVRFPGLITVGRRRILKVNRRRD